LVSHTKIWFVEELGELETADDLFAPDGRWDRFHAVWITAVLELLSKQFFGIA
jgi:hypothetical protein